MISRLSRAARPSTLEEELTHTLTDIAEDLERALRRQSEMERRLDEALNERDRLNVRCAEANAELASVRIRLKSQITGLEMQLAESSKSACNRQQAELAAKEKLIRDEFERKLQELQVAVKQERHQLQQRMANMKAELSGCICRQTMEIAQRR